jgi:hypothetical protein
VATERVSPRLRRCGRCELFQSPRPRRRRPLRGEHSLTTHERKYVPWERSDYFPGVLGKGPVRYSGVEGQFFPYVVHDVHGSKVLPENLGSIAPSTWHSYKTRLPKDIVRAARADLVVRDGFAAFYFHPFLKLDYLKRAVEGIEAAGYRFVSPASL